MSTFTARELLGLDADTLRSLLDLAEGDSPVVRAAYLGLDCSVSEHRAAVERAYAIDAPAAQPFSPPIGAAQPGVRSDLTPTGPAEAGQDDDDYYPGDDALGLPEPDPAAAAGILDLLNSTAGTGRPFMAGTFAMYADPSGAVVIVTETEGTGLRRDVLPRKAVRFALGLIGGKRGGILRRMIGG